jgi:hypothetical protein
MNRLLAALGAVLLVSACGGGGAEPAAQPTGATSVAPQPTVSACAKPGSGSFAWPKEVPADLPQPPGAVLDKVTRTEDGLTIVRFRTLQSLQESVLFVVREVQEAGFTLGRGDAEPAEADAPFGRGDLRGVYKMLNTAPCVTDWLVAVTRTQPTSTSPLLPTPTGTPGSQPLPFG